MSSQITHAQLSNIHPVAAGLAHILGTCSLIPAFCAFFHSLPQPHPVMAPYSSQGATPQERWRAVRKNTGT